MNKNKVIYIHQSLWGEVNHGHGMIATSLEDDNLNQELSSFSDRPGSTYGLNMPPYFSGKRIGEYFIFTKTFSDSFSSRPGMVFTHALIFNIDDIINIDNIAFIFEMFSNENIDKAREDIELNIIEYEILSSLDTSFKYTKYLQTIIQKLLTDKLPIIFSGKESNFIQLLQIIWKGAFPSIRRNIKFQIGFSPNDTPQNNDFTIIFVNEIFLDKWMTYPIVKDDDISEVKLENDAERLLLGDIQSNEFHSFINELDIHLDSFKLITIVYRAYRYYKKLNNCSISESLQLIRTITKVSPSTNASDIKSKAIDRLSILLSTASENEIKGLRNIDFSLFNNGKSKIEKCIEVYIEAQFQGVSINYSSLSSFLCEIFEEKEEISWWHTIIKNKISSIIKSLSNYSVVWKLFLSNNKLLKFFEPFLDITYDKEKQLLITYPKIVDSGFSKEISTFAKSRNWYKLYATINLGIYHIQESLSKQIEIEKDIELYSIHSGLDILLSKISDEDFVKFSLKENNKKLNVFAGEKCIQKPHLLSEIDIYNTVWLDIWAYSLSRTKDITLGISNPQEMIYNVFGQMVNGMQIPNIIIESISNSEFSNIKSYSNRRKLWDKIPSVYVPSFIGKTSIAIFESILNENEEKDVESIIERQILSPDFMERNCYRKPLKSILFVYDKFPSLNEKYLLTAINDYSNNNIDILDSEKLGMLTERNQWQNVAEKILDKAKNNNSYRPALNKCSSLISWWNKIFYSNLFNEKISEQDYYKILYELAVVLYEQGPEENDIWKRAGGDVSLLSNRHNRKEQWFSAIEKLRLGGGGREITPSKLLREIKKDYPYKYYTEIEKLIEYFNKK